MSVAINSTRKTVEISWDPSGGPRPDNELPDGFPPYPDNSLPGDQPYPDQGLPGDQPRPDQGLPGDQPRPDQGLPEDQPRPDQGLPGDQPRPDQGLPGEQPKPSHPIYLPPYIDNSLPGNQPYPDQGLPEFPPDIVDEIDPEVLEKIKEFLEGNLPPYSGGPDYAAPVSAGSVEAVQVFAQGQDGDWSNTAVMPNDGLAALVYPQDFTGESYVEVRALDGSLVDSGTISVS